MNTKLLTQNTNLSGERNFQATPTAVIMCNVLINLCRRFYLGKSDFIIENVSISKKEGTPHKHTYE